MASNNRSAGRTSGWGVVIAAAVGAGMAGLIPHLPALAAPAEAPDKPAAKEVSTFEVYKDKAGEFRWRLKASNGQVIATSGQGYGEKRDCLNGIESVKKYAAQAKVEEAPDSGK